MRILWFANSTLTSEHKKHGYNGCGWISSLQAELMKCDEIHFGLSMISTNTKKVVENDVSYYYIQRQKKSISEKILGGLTPNSQKYERRHWKYYEDEFLKVINDFKPDIIQVFGTEFYYGLVGSKTKVPVIVHIQGILDTCRNAYFPASYSPLSYYLYDLSPKKIWSRFQTFAEWKRLCIREQEIFSRVKYYIGRTDWDKACLKVFNPDACYFFGEEILREQFYNEPHRKVPPICTITTTISAAMYKGLDNVLKAAKCLKAIMGNNFVWNVYGNVGTAIAEKITGIKHEEVNVNLCGVVSADDLCIILQESTVYYHSSYIENTSNAIGEAQMMECPVVANYVGGVPSNLHNGVEGFLVPANDPYQTAYRIYEIFSDSELAENLGKAGRRWALQRHDKNKIVSDLLTTYKEIHSRSHG